MIGGDTNDLDDEEFEILGRYHPDQFDRRAINRALAQLAAGSHEGDRRGVVHYIDYGKFAWGRF